MAPQIRNLTSSSTLNCLPESVEPFVRKAASTTHARFLMTVLRAAPPFMVWTSHQNPPPVFLCIASPAFGRVTPSAYLCKVWLATAKTRATTAASSKPCSSRQVPTLRYQDHSSQICIGSLCCDNVASFRDLRPLVRQNKTNCKRQGGMDRDMAGTSKLKATSLVSCCVELHGPDSSAWRCRILATWLWGNSS